MSAASRLRKAFRYPSEDDDAHELDELDEEHQEQLITNLQQEDAAKNALYRKLFLAIPLAGALLFLPSLFSFDSTARQRMLAITGLSSMGCTAYTLLYQAIESPVAKGKKALYRIEAEKGPLERYLVPAHAALLALQQLGAFVGWWTGAPAAEVYLQSLPLIIFGLAMFVRQQLAPLDLEELQKARYELKGA